MRISDAEFQDRVEKWKNLSKTADKTTAENYYWTELFDEVVERVNQHSNNISGKYPYLISLVGFSPEPIILTIMTVRPEEVTFLVTEDTRSQLDMIIEKTGLKPRQYNHVEVDSSDVRPVYTAIQQFMRNREPQNVLLDITGGKKSMVGGAAMVGALLECAICYVDFGKEYLPDLRKPYPGTEFINVLENPYSTFGDVEIRHALRFYENGDFAAATETLGRLEHRIPDARRIKIQRTIIAAFQQWEGYQFDRALKNLTQVLLLIDRYGIYEELRQTIEARINVLHDILNNEVRWIILNHYFMAHTYYKRQKYDFAVLMLYRTMEMLLTDRLQRQYNLEASAPDYSQFPDLLEQYNRKVPEIYGPDSRIAAELPHKPGFMAVATFLSIFDDEVMENINLAHLREQADQRNKGILAHGVQANTAGNFDGMDKAFRPLIQRYMDIYLTGRSVKNVNDYFEPVQL
jgi:CRISPR-associated protein (TIGR02710 family)